MKKVKFLLSAVAVFAVIGGVAAVKANTSQHVFVTKTNPNVCDFRINATLLDQQQGTFGIIKATEVSGPCETTLVYNPL